MWWCLRCRRAPTASSVLMSIKCFAGTPACVDVRLRAISTSPSLYGSWLQRVRQRIRDRETKYMKMADTRRAELRASFEPIRSKITQDVEVYEWANRGSCFRLNTLVMAGLVCTCLQTALMSPDFLLTGDYSVESVVVFIVGHAIAFYMCAFSQRMVSRIVLRAGGDHLRITTRSLLLKDVTFQVHVDRAVFSKKRSEVGRIGLLKFRVRGMFFPLVVSTTRGTFNSPVLFDDYVCACGVRV